MEEYVSDLESDDNEEKIANWDLSFNSTVNSDSPPLSAPTMPVSLPCLACASDCLENAIKAEVNSDYEDDDEDNPTKLEDNGEKIFNWFLKWFRIDILKNKKGVCQRKKKMGGWDDGEGSQPLQFCGACKGHLENLLELQIKVEELEREIREGMSQVKGTMERCEGIFESSGIYERDSRYQKIRSKIVSNVKSAARKIRSRRNSQGEDEPKRKSGRPKKKMASKLLQQTGRLTKREDDDIDGVPVVLLSSIDKAAADHHILVKLEIEDPVIMETKKRPKRLASLKNKKVAIDLLEDELDEEDWIPKKKRKQKDEDFIPPEDETQDNFCSDDDNDRAGAASPHDDSEDEDDLKESGKKKRKFIEDPSNNLLTYGKFNFTILTDDPSTSAASPTVQCLLCNLILPKHRDRIRDHVIRTHTKRFACSKCPARFTGKAKLTYHILMIHEGGDPEKRRVHQMKSCKICGKPVRTSGLKRHEFSHMNTEEREAAFNNDELPDCFRKRWQCDECGHKFGSPYGLKMHQERRHGVGGGGDGQKREVAVEMKLCPECGGSYRDVENHIRRVHKKGKLWECLEEGCGKKFNILSALARHKDRIHRKIKKFSCPHCPREFFKRMQYDQHLNNHLGIRPFKCADCDSDFTAKAALKNHRKIFHTEGSKPKRRSYVRGPTVLGAGVKQEELKKRGEYFPPSALASWAKGREPAEGHVWRSSGPDEEFDGNI